MPRSEVEICQRLRDFRKATRLSRVSFASLADIDLTTLANYEHARSPVRFGVVEAIADAFDLNPLWLATGRTSPIGSSRMPPAVSVCHQDLFSRVYRDHLRSWYAREKPRAGKEFHKFIDQIRRARDNIQHLGQKERESPFWRKTMLDMSGKMEAFSEEISAFRKRRELIEAELKKVRSKKMD